MSHLPDRLEIRRLDEFRWEIPVQGRMNVPGRVFADAALMEAIRDDRSLRQVANVACLPGIVGHSIGMPDIHWGYGFAIGGVAAFDPAAGGVISPGGVGYDINCGVRLLRTSVTLDELGPRRSRLMDRLLRDIPAGVGEGYETASRTLSAGEVREVLERGAEWAVDHGMGTLTDLAHTEGGGRLDSAEPGRVGERAVERGRAQLGTVGSGNHFVELGRIREIYDGEVAEALGLASGAIAVLIHSGSRGLGHQVCTDHLDAMLDAAERHGIDLPDRQLACAPLESPEGRAYLGAMGGAANFAFANRQVMTHRVRTAFADVMGRPWEELGIEVVYDVAHNNAKWEAHGSGGRTRRLCVHRKGATRAFPPGHAELPEAYRGVGQPVLIPGDMARYSYVLVGTDGAFSETFGSTCHGAGRRMSRRQAKRSVRGRDLEREFRERGIEVRSASRATVAEEVPEAYKDVADVVRVVDAAGIGRRVARLEPVGVLKG